jgi:NAD(P)-dependent dehydrogenase (short-subunit alcohol dehydrogenase family)
LREADLPDYRLAGKVAVVTGGARGIGEAISRRLSADGAKIVVADIDLPEARETANSMAGSIAVRCDISDVAEVETLANEVEKSYGRIDIIVNNASVLDVTSLESMTIDSYRRVIDINLNGAVYISKALLPLMKKSGGGRIIHISSINGFRGQPDNLPYATAKGGVVNMGRAMAAELGKHNITVNVICPGFIDTRMAIIPGTTTHESETEWFRDIYIKHGRIFLGRYGKPEDVAGAAYFFASDDSRYVTGQVLAVDGGVTATF